MATIGSLRFESHLRELAALALLTAVNMIIQPLPSITARISGDGQTPNDGTPLWILIGGLCLVAVGSASLLFSYHALVHLGHTDAFMKNFLVVLLVAIQTAFIPYITLMVEIGQNARKDVMFNKYISPMYTPSELDVDLVASMGILSVLTYGFALVGSLAFFLYTMRAFLLKKPELRAAGYYRKFHLLFSGVLALAGFSQLFLGAYIQKNFTNGGGKLDYGPIAVAVFVVNFPAMNIVVGGLQVLFGMWGMLRTFHIALVGQDDLDSQQHDKTFQLAMFGSLFLQLALQVITQIGYVPGDLLSENASKIACLSIALNLMPAYLDYKMRSLPSVIDQLEYYGLGGAVDEVAPKVLDDDDDDSTPVKHAVDEEGQ
jgi:hypothetical protein